jgi:tetratricopeptide (TPR) repeat protein
MIRARSFWIFAVLMIAAFGCQSVATTSAKLRNQEGNYEQAIKLAQEAIAKNPKDAEAHFQLGVSYSYLDSVALAYDHFTKAKELDPEKSADVDNNIQSNFAKHYKLGQSSFNRADMKTAAGEFELATRANPTQSVAYYNLAVTYQRLAESESAVKITELEDTSGTKVSRDVTRQTENKKAHEYHVRSLTAADKVLSLSSPTESNYVKALRLAGEELIALHREGEAAQRFKRLIDEDPASYKVIEDIGTTELDEKNYKAAAEFLKLAAKAREKVGAPDAKVYYNIGVSLYNLRKEDRSRIDDAISYYQKALEITPDDPDTVFNILVAYAFKEDWSNAAQWGEKYVNVNANDANGWKLLARSYTELGDQDRASEAMKRYEMLKQQ